MKTLLKFHKMFNFSRTRIEKLKEGSVSQFKWAQKTLRHFTNVHMAQALLNNLVKDIEFYFALAREVTTKNII